MPEKSGYTNAVSGALPTAETILPTTETSVVTDPEGQVSLTRSQAARRMGVSVATVRRMEGAELQPVVINGKHLFSLEDVDRHRKASDGDLAAQAFQMFNEDKTQVDVVIALKESPDRIRKLFSDWTAMSECLVVGPPGLGRRALWRYLGSRLTRRCVTMCIQSHSAIRN